MIEHTISDTWIRGGEHRRSIEVTGSARGLVPLPVTVKSIGSMGNKGVREITGLPGLDKRTIGSGATGIIQCSLQASFIHLSHGNG